jgi:AcrR family transcriptional regulator
MTAVMTAVTNNRALPRKALQERIRSAAIAAFRAHGYEETTIEEIASRASVAKGTFFNFYKTKLDVLIEYYWSIDDEVRPLRLALDPARPQRALELYAAKVERIFEREGSLLTDLLAQTLRDNAMRKLDHDSGDSDARDFATFLSKARQLRTVRSTLDPDRAAVLVIDVWAGAVRAWMANRDGSRLSTIFKTKVADLFQGFGPEISK